MLVIVRKDGINRTYRCGSQFDAIELFDALTRGMGNARIELWDGAKLVTSYEA
ncbi:MAG: hypothetical protein ACO3SE_07190 [Sedimenticolaceae bacterium]